MNIEFEFAGFCEGYALMMVMKDGTIHRVAESPTKDFIVGGFPEGEHEFYARGMKYVDGKLKGTVQGKKFKRTVTAPKPQPAPVLVQPVNEPEPPKPEDVPPKLVSAEQTEAEPDFDASQYFQPVANQAPAVITKEPKVPFANMNPDGGSGLVSGGASAPPPVSGPEFGRGTPDPRSQGEWNGGADIINFDYPNPAQWPGNEAPGQYFYDPSHPSATDSSNTYGYPDRPRLTAPEGITLQPGDTVTMGNTSGSVVTNFGGNSMNFGTAGTAALPCIVRTGWSGQQPVTMGEKFEFNASSVHCILDGFKFFNSATDVDIDAGGMRYITVRNFLCDGDNSANPPSGKATFALSGSSNALRNQYLCYYNNTVRNIGVWGANRDQLAFVGGSFYDNVWILNNTSSNIAGDSFRAGEHNASTNLGADRGTNLWCYGNNFGNNEENPLDIKQCVDHYFFNNTFATSPIGSIEGGLIPIHQYCERIWFGFNDIYNGDQAVVVSSDGGDVGDLYFIRNRIHQVPGTNADDHCFRNRSVIQTPATMHFINNTCWDYNTAVSQSSNVNLSTPVIGNLFAGRKVVGSGNDVVYEGSSGGNGQILDHNAHESLRVTVNNTTQTTLAGLQGAGHNLNGAEGAVNLTNPGAGDFTTGTGSVARGVGMNAAGKAVYDLYESTTGVNIEFDYNGNALPTDLSQWDAGAHQA